MRVVQTEDKSFVRDLHSKALLNTDRVALENHRKNKQLELQKAQRFQEMENKVKELDNILNKYISEGSTPFKNKDFGNKAIEREIFYTLLRTLKKANMISNDVYDEAGSRNPEPFEIRSAYNELNQLFTNPNQFLAGKTKSLIAFRMNDSDKARRAEGQKLAGEWIEMFTPENLLKNRATFGDRVALYKNFITKGEYFLPKNVFGFENVSMLDVGSTTGAKNPFMMSLGGHHLWKLANMDGFHSKGIEGLERIQLQKGTNFERAGMFVDKIEQFVETAVMYGESRDGFANKLMSRVNQDGTFEFKLNGDSFGNQGVFSIKESMNNGILRNLIERQMKEIQTSIEYFRAENFTNPNKIERFTNRLANLKVAADIMDLQTVRDITIPSKDYIFNQSNYQKFGEKKFVNLAKKQGKKGTVAVWRLKGDVKSTNISELKWGDKGANNLSDLRFTDVNLSEGAKFVNQKQLEFVGYFNAKSRKVGDLYAGYTYIVDTKPKKYVNISDKELKWNRALFKATYGDETANYFLRESSRAEEFYKDLKSLRAEISTGYFTTVKNSLANKVLSKDIFAFNDVQEGFAINKFMKKWRNELVDSADPVDFLLRNILKPQKAPTYTSDDKGQYIPNFTTNNHLQKTVLKWAIESEGGQNRGFLEPFIKDVQGYYEGSKSFKTNDYVKAHRGQINYDYAGGTATQTMLKYLDVFYANPTMEYNLSRRMNETIGINRSFKDQSGQQYEYLQGRPIRRKPEDFKGKWDSVSDQNGKGC